MGQRQVPPEPEDSGGGGQQKWGRSLEVGGALQAGFSAAGSAPGPVGRQCWVCGGDRQQGAGGGDGLRVAAASLPVVLAEWPHLASPFPTPPGTQARLLQWDLLPASLAVARL